MTSCRARSAAGGRSTRTRPLSCGASSPSSPLGRSPKAIARRLNDDGIPGPRGILWRDTAIRGHRQRGTGLLNNELYIGRLVWNRLRYVKDPASGRRVSRLNPPEAWVVERCRTCASSTTRSGRR
jgi:hypothetical protein